MNRIGFKKSASVVALICFGFHIWSQDLTIEKCYQLAAENYPIIAQRDLIQRSADYSIDNLSKNRLPQVALTGSATLQSAVPAIEIPFPNIEIPKPPKGQYKVAVEAAQSLSDFKTIKAHQQLQTLQAQTQLKNIDVELYKLRERVNQLFFGVLLIDEQSKQNELLKKDIQTGINRVTAAIQNGVEYRSSLEKLQTEMLRAQQRDIELRWSRKAFIDMLGLLINQPLSENAQLVKPEIPALNDQIQRPELALFEAQKSQIAQQEILISEKQKPKFSLFLQAGVGQPSPLNFLDSDLSPYAIGGARINWPLNPRLTKDNERSLLLVQQRMIDAQKETFVYNSRIQLQQQNDEISKLRALIDSDNEMLKLRASIKAATQAQLENGVITANEYIREINAEDMIRQTAALRQMQILVSMYNHKTISGN